MTTINWKRAAKAYRLRAAYWRTRFERLETSRASCCLRMEEENARFREFLEHYAATSLHSYVDDRPSITSEDFRRVLKGEWP